MSITKEALTFLLYFVTFLALAQKLHFTLVKKLHVSRIGKKGSAVFVFPEMAALLTIDSLVLQLSPIQVYETLGLYSLFA